MSTHTYQILILTLWIVKEVLRDQPEDIVAYWAEYFKAKEEGKEFEYQAKGHRPIPPNKITRAELDQIRGYNEEDYMEMDGEGEYPEGEYPEGEYMEGEYVPEGGKRFLRFSKILNMTI